MSSAAGDASEAVALARRRILTPSVANSDFGRNLGKLVGSLR
jgi:hypothetical protein